MDKLMNDKVINQIIYIYRVATWHLNFLNIHEEKDEN